MKFNVVPWIMGIISALAVGGSLAWASSITTKADTVGSIIGQLEQINQRLDRIERVLDK